MVDWGDAPQANRAARALAARLRESGPEFCAEAVAGVRTLAVRLATDERMLRRPAHRQAALAWLNEAAVQALEWPAPIGRRVVLPACYDAAVAPDIEAVAHASGLSVREVAQIHSACEFTAEVIGFMPGFAYLGGLDPRLKLDRRAMPRAQVPQGSIAIAGLQTAVYPSATPGGWHLIGRCPSRLFDPARSPASLIGDGDTVVFEPVDRERFETLWAQR